MAPHDAPPPTWLQALAAQQPPVSSASPAAPPAELAALADALAAPPPAGIARATAQPPGCSRPQPNLFSGAALVDWLLTFPAAAAAAADGDSAGSSARTLDRPAALALAQRLLQSQLVNLVADERPVQCVVRDDASPMLRLRCEAPRTVPYGSPLNRHYWWAGPARPAEQVRGLQGRRRDGRLCGSCCLPPALPPPAALSHTTPPPHTHTQTRIQGQGLRSALRTLARVSARITALSAGPMSSENTTPGSAYIQVLCGAQGGVATISSSPSAPQVPCHASHGAAGGMSACCGPCRCAGALEYAWQQREALLRA